MTMEAPCPQRRVTSASAHKATTSTGQHNASDQNTQAHTANTVNELDNVQDASHHRSSITIRKFRHSVRTRFPCAFREQPEEAEEEESLSSRD